MLKRLSISLWFLCGFLALAQNNVVLLDSKPLDADVYFGTDVLGFDYFAKNNVLYKQKDNSRWEYKNLSLGQLHSIDFINPLKAVAFYKDFNTVVLLDNTFSEIAKISLNDYGIIAQTCSMASQNQFWIYDSLTSKLMLLNYVTRKTHTINQSFAGDFIYVLSNYNYWYRITATNEIYAYDNYGKVTLKGVLPEFDKIIMTDSEHIIFSLGDNLYLYQNNLVEHQLLFSHKQRIESFDFKNGVLTLSTQNNIENYNLKLP